MREVRTVSDGDGRTDGRPDEPTDERIYVHGCTDGRTDRLTEEQTYRRSDTVARL